jgi:hypothetical protein
MFKVLLQRCYTRPQMEAARGSGVIMRFVGLSLRDETPDHSTLCPPTMCVAWWSSRER